MLDKGKVQFFSIFHFLKSHTPQKDIKLTVWNSPVSLRDALDFRNII